MQAEGEGLSAILWCWFPAEGQGVHQVDTQDYVNGVATFSTATEDLPDGVCYATSLTPGLPMSGSSNGILTPSGLPFGPPVPVPEPGEIALLCGLLLLAALKWRRRG